MSKEIPIIWSHVLGPIHSPFPAFFTSIHDLKHYCHPNSPLIFWAVTANQRIPKKFQQFGPKFWDQSNGPSRPQTNRNMEKPLKMGINTSREKLLPLGVVKNSQTRGPRIACSHRTFSLLAPSKSNGPIACISREKLETLSLEMKAP